MSGWQPERAQVWEVDCMKKFDGIFPCVVVWTEDGKKGPLAPRMASCCMSIGGEGGLTMTFRGSCRADTYHRTLPNRASPSSPAIQAERQACRLKCLSPDPTLPERAFPHSTMAQATDAAKAKATCQWRIQRCGRMA